MRGSRWPAAGVALLTVLGLAVVALPGSAPAAAGVRSSSLRVLGSVRSGAVSATVIGQQTANGLSPIPNDVPAVVADGAAKAVAPHDPSATLRVNVGLVVRNSAHLDDVILAASTPGSPDFGHYLTRAEYSSSYAPTTEEADALTHWLEAQGLSVEGVAKDNLWVTAAGSTDQMEQAFGVSIDDYRYGGRTFFSNGAEPAVPADLNVSWVTGLSDYPVITTATSATSGATRSTAHAAGGGSPPFFPSDFSKGYDAPAGFNASGQTIGMTLWYAPLQQSDLSGF